MLVYGFFPPHEFIFPCRPTLCQRNESQILSTIPFVCSLIIFSRLMVMTVQPNCLPCRASAQPLRQASSMWGTYWCISTEDRIRNVKESLFKVVLFRRSSRRISQEQLYSKYSFNSWFLLLHYLYFKKKSGLGKIEAQRKGVLKISKSLVKNTSIFPLETSSQTVTDNGLCHYFHPLLHLLYHHCHLFLHANHAFWHF